MHSFWGPNMQALLCELDRRGVLYSDMSPAAFAQMMDDKTQASHVVGEHPEDAAKRWLEALNG
jgi:hypothetical protein